MKVDYSLARCDVHHASVLRQMKATFRSNSDPRNVISYTVYSCSTDGCSRYYFRSVGYQSRAETLGIGEPSPKCDAHNRFMVVVPGGSGYHYVCPDDNCTHTSPTPEERN